MILKKLANELKIGDILLVNSRGKIHKAIVLTKKRPRINSNEQEILVYTFTHTHSDFGCKIELDCTLMNKLFNNPCIDPRPTYLNLKDPIAISATEKIDYVSNLNEIDTTLVSEICNQAEFCLNSEFNGFRKLCDCEQLEKYSISTNKCSSCEQNSFEPALDVSTIQSNSNQEKQPPINQYPLTNCYTENQSNTFENLPAVGSFHCSIPILFCCNEEKISN